jgi:hypothetical protein
MAVMPASCDLPADLPGRDAADAVNVALARAWDWQKHQRTLQRPPAATHIYGYSSLGYQPVADHLDRVLPCRPSGRHRLVAELVPGPVLPGWCADEQRDWRVRVPSSPGWPRRRPVSAPSR